MAQTALREEAAACGCDVVDLPQLFNDYLRGEIPNRRMFLDYCHLTTEGIRVAMAAAASFVLRRLKDVEVPWSMLLNDEIAPSLETEAEASVLAAIYNAHWWQSYELVRHWCSRALSLSPHISDLMLNHIELQTRRSAPERMSESERIFQNGSPLVRFYVLRLNEKRLDKVLLDAFVDALEEAGVDARERLNRLRREEHSVSRAAVNLLDYYYLSAANQPRELAGVNQNTEKKFRHHGDYYRAYWPESRFVFVGEAGHAVQLSLTCRLPNRGAQPAPISVMLNGKPHLEILIDHNWSAWEINLSGKVVREGLNEIAVRWPTPEFNSREAREQTILNLCEMKFPDFYPAFGEIHSFTAASAEQVSLAPPTVHPELAAIV